MSLKPLFLTILVVMPVLVFLFLKIFGVNQYEIPVYYENGLQNPNCGLELTAQYEVPALEYFGMSKIQTELPAKPRLYLNGPSSHRNEQIPASLVRLLQSPLFHDDVDVVIFYGDDADLNDNFSSDLMLVRGSPQQIDKFFRCGLILNKADYASWIILVDSQRRIRGYYDGEDDEEVERLDLEVTILLQD